MEQQSNKNDLRYKGSALKINRILDLGKLNGVTENPLSFTESSVDLENFSQKFNGINDDLLCDKFSHLDVHALEVDSEISKPHLSETSELVESDWLDFQEADVQNKTTSGVGIDTIQDFLTSKSITKLFPVEPKLSFDGRRNIVKDLNGDKVWNELVKCDCTPALKFNWIDSQCKVRLIKSLSLQPPFSLKQTNVKK